MIHVHMGLFHQVLEYSNGTVIESGKVSPIMTVN